MQHTLPIGPETYALADIGSFYTWVERGEVQCLIWVLDGSAISRRIHARGAEAAHLVRDMYALRYPFLATRRARAQRFGETVSEDWERTWLHHLHVVAAWSLATPLTNGHTAPLN